MRSGKIALACVVVTTLGLLGLPASGARADSPAALTQLTGFHQIVADSAAGHVFLSEGISSEQLVHGTDSATAIVVTDLSGHYVTTLDAGHGVEGLTISPDGSVLYAALATDHAIDVINASTLAQITTYSLGTTGDIPYGLAVQSSKLWVSYDVSSSLGVIITKSAIGDFDLSVTSPAFETQAATGGWYSAPDIAADPGDSGVLAAVLPDMEPASAATFDTTTDPVSAIAARAFLGSSGGIATECTFEDQLAVVPGGSQFITACNLPAGANVYDSGNLASSVSSYTSSAFPRTLAVALSPGGTVATGGVGPASSAVSVYQPDGTLLNVLDLGSNETVAAGGLSWSADGKQLFAVLNQSGTTSYSLAVFSDPTLTQSALTLNGPSSAILDDTLTLTGRLTLANGAALPPETTVAITRTAPGNTTTTTSLPAAQPGPDGSFTVTDNPTQLGTYTYTATYTGDASTAPATATLTVTVALNTAKLTLSGPAVVTFGRNVVITGKLSLSTGSPAAQTPVTVTRTESGSTAVKKFTLRTVAGGGFTLTDPAPAKGHYTYTVSYAGNATTTAAKAAFAVTVARTTPALTVTTSAADYAYGTRAAVTATLGATFADRTVSIYARPAGMGATLLKTGRVNARGILTVSYLLSRSTVFSAVFAGDVHNAPKTATRGVGVRVKVVMSNSGWFTTTVSRGITFRVYHHTGHLNTAVAVTPNKHGQCIDLEVQQWEGQLGWQPNETFGCFTLNSSSRLSTYLLLTQAAGAQYRMRADYVRSARDTTNLSTEGSWFYFQVVN